MPPGTSDRSSTTRLRQDFCPDCSSLSCPSDGFDAIYSARSLPEGFAANFEILELVETGAGRRQQHYNLAAVVLGRIMRGMLDRRGQRARYLVRHRLAQRRRKGRRRLADQLGLGDAREEAPQR